jgi:O-antigen/teichoic acid export membrane protein
VSTALERRLGPERAARAGGLRRLAAGGAVVNAVFLVALNGLGLLKGFIVAGFLTAHDYGVWGLLFISLGTLYWLKDIGVADKFVQQDDADQEVAFQKAFTIELLLTGLFVLVLAAAVPLLALIYGTHQIIAPGFAICAILPALALQSPVWVYYRRMDYVRQRTLQAADPLVAFTVTVALAAAGLGYWALVLGVAGGSWTGALIALRFSPYRLKLRYERTTLRSYASFSWPLFLVNGSSVVIVQAAVFVGQKAIGLAGVGIITLASSISAYTDQADAIVTQTLYPAICAVKDRTELLFETFVKSNRLTLMWGVPFGVGLSLFADDLVHALGPRWYGAAGVIRAFGLIAAAAHIGFNWHAFYRARAQTRPLAVVAVLLMVVFLAVAVPLTYSDHLNGFALGMAIVAAVHLAARWYYLRKLFSGFAMARHAARAIAPTVPAAAAVLLVRLAESSRVPLAELALYAAVTIAATWLLERDLLREVLGYVRGPRAAAAHPTPRSA